MTKPLTSGKISIIDLDFGAGTDLESFSECNYVSLYRIPAQRGNAGKEIAG